MRIRRAALRSVLLAAVVTAVAGAAGFALPAQAATTAPSHIPLDDANCAYAQDQLTHYTMLSAGTTSTSGLYDYAIAYWESEVSVWC
jgi:ABC-type phosphate transport system substrate-binding protein